MYQEMLTDGIIIKDYGSDELIITKITASSWLRGGLRVQVNSPKLQGMDRADVSLDWDKVQDIYDWLGIKLAERRKEAAK